jgi:hypothetical protein
MGDVRHQIKVFLYPNALTDEAHDYVARVKTERLLDITELCQSAAGRGGADISADAIYHGMTLGLKEAAWLLCDGFGINFGPFIAKPHITGVFHSPEEHFSPDKHKLTIKITASASLKKEAAETLIDVMGVAETGIHISEVIDVKSGEVNGEITPGYVLRIHGNKLKVEGNKPEVGVYFINISSKAETKVDPTDFVTNTPKEVLVMIPNLPHGDYQLKMVSQYTNTNRLLQEPRIEIFEHVLTSGPPAAGE